MTQECAGRAGMYGTGGPCGRDATRDGLCDYHDARLRDLQGAREDARDATREELESAWGNPSRADAVERHEASERRKMDRRGGNGAEWDAQDDAAEYEAAQDDALAAAQADAAELTGGPREYLMLPLESKDHAAPYWYGGWECEGTAPDVRRAYPDVEDGEPVYLYFSRPLSWAAGPGFGAVQQRARLASGLVFASDVTALLQGRERDGTLLERVAVARAEYLLGNRA